MKKIYEIISIELNLPVNPRLHLHVYAWTSSSKTQRALVSQLSRMSQLSPSPTRTVGNWRQQQRSHDTVLQTQTETGSTRHYWLDIMTSTCMPQQWRSRNLQRCDCTASLRLVCWHFTWGGGKHQGGKCRERSVELMALTENLDCYISFFW